MVSVIFSKLCPPKLAWCCLVLAFFNFALMIPLALVMKSGNEYLRLATTEKDTGGTEEHEPGSSYEKKASVMFYSVLFYAVALVLSLLSIWSSRSNARRLAARQNN